MVMDPMVHLSQLSKVNFKSYTACDHINLASGYIELNHFFSSCFFFYNVYFFGDISGKTYRFRISNVGLQHSLNFRIQGHKMKLVEVEGTHTIQTTYSSLDVHVGQSYSVLVTMDQPPQDFYIAVSTRFTNKVLTSTGTLHYSNSAHPVSGPVPGGPTTQIDWSLNQARSIR